MAHLRILLADDHTMVRQGLRKILEEQPGWEIVAEAADGREAVRQAKELKPDVAILDIGMPLLTGIEATRQIVHHIPEARVLILSMYADATSRRASRPARRDISQKTADTDLIRAVTAVSHTYSKTRRTPNLIRAVAAVLRGGIVLQPSVARVMLDDYVRRLAERGVTDRYDSLSAREREVFQLIAEVHSNKEIAELLALSPSTVETHRGHIMEKLKLHSAAEVVLYAVRRGVIR